jgi:hypothetical protein
MSFGFFDLLAHTPQGITQVGAISAAMWWSANMGKC